MKKLLSLVLCLGIGFGLVGCGSSNNPKEEKKESSTSYKDKLKTASFKTQVDGVIYTKELDNGDNIAIFIEDGYITYENIAEDSQISYSFNEDTSDMYGCKYHYSDSSTTEDGEGFGGCTESTTRILKEDKVKIDTILKESGLEYSDLKN